jgi:hypothetical protein
LIEFTTKNSGTRGCSALLREIGEIEALMESLSFEDEGVNKFLQGCEKSSRGRSALGKFVATEVRGFI